MKFLVWISAGRNFALGLCLLLTGKLFLAPAFDPPFADFLGWCLVVSGVVSLFVIFVRQSPMLLGAALLVGDAVLIYFLVNRLFVSAEGLYGLPILLAALVAQDFALIPLSFRKAPVDALHQ